MNKKVVNPFQVQSHCRKDNKCILLSFSLIHFVYFESELMEVNRKHRVKSVDYWKKKLTKYSENFSQFVLKHRKNEIFVVTETFDAIFRDENGFETGSVADSSDSLLLDWAIDDVSRKSRDSGILCNRVSTAERSSSVDLRPKSKNRWTWNVRQRVLFWKIQQLLATTRQWVQNNAV